MTNEWKLIERPWEIRQPALVYRDGWPGPCLMSWLTHIWDGDAGRWFDDGDLTRVPDEFQPTHYLDYPDPLDAVRVVAAP